MQENVNLANINNLEKKLNYKFNNINLLKSALVHKSYANFEYKNGMSSNERLEFLGDRILGLAVAEYLYNYFENETEGVLSSCIAYLNSSNTLYEIAKTFELNKFTLVHDVNESSLKKIYANTVEAILAAIYLDSNYETVKNIIIKFWQPYVATSLNSNIKVNFNPKSLLQEWAQKKGLPIPNYVNLKQEGTEHQPVFYVSLIISGFSKITAKGTTKKIAQKNAALEFINTNHIIKE